VSRLRATGAAAGAIVLFLLLASGPADAQRKGGGGGGRGGGVAVSPDALPEAARVALMAAIAEARSRVPAAFAAIADLRSRLPDLDAARRGPIAPVTPLLRSLGPDALMPMLAELALDALPRGALADAAWTAWRSGLIEAVGALRDTRAEPVLAAALDAPDVDHAVVRAAAEALGKLGTDAAVARLTALAARPGPKRTGVLAGMGACRRAACVGAISDALAGRLDEEVALLAVRSLGHAGSEWAWRTPTLASGRAGLEAEVRAAAAAALVAAFVNHGGDVRAAASNSLMTVADPATPALIARAVRATGDAALRTELEALSARFDRLTGQRR